METFSALLAICAGISPAPGEFRAQRPVTRSFDVFFFICVWDINDRSYNNPHLRTANEETLKNSEEHIKRCF